VTTSTGGLTKETDLLTTAFDLQRGVVDKLQVTLDSQVADLEAATQAAKDYSTTLASQLLGGIDLGAAQETGTELGISTLDAFDRQIEPRPNWFGNVLSSIKAQRRRPKTYRPTGIPRPRSRWRTRAGNARQGPCPDVQ
jgi:hypothetical protein